jgi:phosphoenolpyruvate---glycerone phosphotransferase subunit DhaL
MITRDAVIAWIKNFRLVIAQNREYLTQLDSAIGDADHGINMDRGFGAVEAKLAGVADSDIGNIFKTTGMTLVSTVGGAGGPLYGTFFMKAGTVIGAKNEMSGQDWLTALDAGLAGVQQRGKSTTGEKTMVDALTPARDALRAALEQGQDLGQALAASANAAEQGMQATIPMLATKGRASYLGERSIGHQDPGATSSFLMLKCAADTWG